MKEEQRRSRVYRSTERDAEAAEKLGISVAAFRQWRLSRGLASKSRPGPDFTMRDEARRMEAYRRAESDADAAARAKVSVHAFRKWRQQRDLPAKGKPGRKVDDKVRERVVRASATDAEAARALGVARRTVSHWRTMRGIERR